MLKITNCGSATEQRWVLCGQLTGPWVRELRANWEQTRDESGRRKAVVDLRDVTFIDERGQKLLDQMQSEGAEFVASGVDTKDVIDGLAKTGGRPVRKFLIHMGDGNGSDDVK